MLRRDSRPDEPARRVTLARSRCIARRISRRRPWLPPSSGTVHESSSPACASFPSTEIRLTVGMPGRMNSAELTEHVGADGTRRPSVEADRRRSPAGPGSTADRLKRMRRPVRRPARLVAEARDEPLGTPPLAQDRRASRRHRAPSRNTIDRPSGDHCGCDSLASDVVSLTGSGSPETLLPEVGVSRLGRSRRRSTGRQAPTRRRAAASPRRR